MSTDLERGLREVLEDLFNVDPPTGVAARAIARAKRRRRSARAGSLLAAIAVAGTITLSVVVVGPDHGAPPAGATPSVGSTPSVGPTIEGTSRVVLVYGGLTNGQGGPVESLVLNMSTGEYERLPYRSVVPSPDGRHLFVIEPDSAAQYMPRSGLLDRASGDVEWLPISGSTRDHPQWSPDGSTVLLTDHGVRDGQSGFTLVDVATVRKTFVSLPDLWTENALGLRLSFTADASGVLLVRSQGSGSEADLNVRLTAIDRYTLDGQLSGSVPLELDDVRWATLSEDGTRLLALQLPGDGTSSVAVVSVVDGSIVSTMDGMSTVPVLWADDEVAVTFEGAVYTLDGDLVAHLETPPGLFGSGGYQEIVVGSAAGLPMTAAHLTF
jgi:hypothetical protein